MDITTKSSKTKSEDYDRIEMKYGEFGLLRSQQTPEAAVRAFDDYLTKNNPGLLEDSSFRNWAHTTIKKFHTPSHMEYSKKGDDVEVGWYGMSLDKEDRELYTKLQNNWTRSTPFKFTRKNYDAFAKLSETDRKEFIKEGLAPQSIETKVHIGKTLESEGFTPTKGMIDLFESPAEAKDFSTEAKWVSERMAQHKSINLLNSKVASEYEDWKKSKGL